MAARKKQRLLSLAFRGNIRVVDSLRPAAGPRLTNHTHQRMQASTVSANMGQKILQERLTAMTLYEEKVQSRFRLRHVNEHCGSIIIVCKASSTLFPFSSHTRY
jgi:hypothetical protein